MDRKRIDKIIDIKESLKKDKEREIEETHAKMAGIVEEIAGIAATIMQNHDRLCGTLLSGNDFAVITDYIEYLDVSKAALVCEKATVQETIDELQQECFELAKELKMLSKLRDKAMKEFRKSENRRERKMLDEMALRSDDKRI